MIWRLRRDRSSDDHLAIPRLSGNALDQTALKVLLHDHLSIVEEELRMSIGLPPWSDAALCFVLAEIAHDFTKYTPQNRGVEHWIRKRARHATGRLERTIAERHARDGFVNFTTDATLSSLLGSLLDRYRSPHWDELAWRKPRSRIA
jgi:hypothetical protein